MASIQSNARLLSNDALAKWLIEDFPYRIQLAPVFPFHPVAGDALRYATTPALQPGVAIGFGDTIPDDTKHPSEIQRRFEFAEIATRFNVTYRAQDVFSSNANDQTVVQMALAIRELLYRFWTLFEGGDAANDGEFDGLLKLVDPTQVVDLAGSPLTLESLDRAKERVRTNDGRGVVILTTSLGKRAIHAAHWQRGLGPRYEAASLASSPAETGRERMLAFNGAHVFVNDLNRVCAPGAVDCKDAVAPDDAIGLENGVTNIWFFTLGEYCLHGITPAALEDGLFVNRHTIVPDGSTIEHHITLPTGIALGSARALAVVKNASIPANGDGRLQPAKRKARR